jgi:hypothetical protein
MGFTAPTIIWYVNELIFRANTTTVVYAWHISALRHGRTVQAFARTFRPLHGLSGFPCRIRGRTRTTAWRPNSSEHNRPVRIYHRTDQIHLRGTYCCTLCTKLLHTTAAVRSAPTYLNHNTPYDHRPINIIDRSWQEGRHSNARPNEPHKTRSGDLPLDAMEKIGKEMAELF